MHVVTRPVLKDPAVWHEKLLHEMFPAVHCISWNVPKGKWIMDGKIFYSVTLSRVKISLQWNVCENKYLLGVLSMGNMSRCQMSQDKFFGCDLYFFLYTAEASWGRCTQSTSFILKITQLLKKLIELQIINFYRVYCLAIVFRYSRTGHQEN
jgi:hypothetical protein